MDLPIIIIMIVAFIVIATMSAKDAEKKAKEKPIYKQIELPNPETADPRKFLEFILLNDNSILWQVEDQLDSSDKLKNIVLKKALREKVSTNTINVDFYLNILEKLEAGTINENSVQIPDGYSFKTLFSIAGSHIQDRKEYIIFKLEEGVDLELKREPYNSFDENAIAIFHNKKLIGYVPKNINIEVADFCTKKFVAKVGDITYLNNYINVYVYLYTSEVENDQPEFYLNAKTLLELRSRKIESQYLKPKKDAEDLNMFYKKKVVITGEFEFFPDRNEIAKLLFESGADVDVSVTERTDYVIKGKNAGWRKLERIESLGIDTFNETEFRKIFSLHK